MTELFLPDAHAKRGWYAWWCWYWELGWTAYEDNGERWVAVFLGPLMVAWRTKHE